VPRRPTGFRPATSSSGGVAGKRVEGAMDGSGSRVPLVLPERGDAGEMKGSTRISPSWPG
jgi:hypothetical protein